MEGEQVDAVDLFEYSHLFKLTILKFLKADTCFCAQRLLYPNLLISFSSLLQCACLLPSVTSFELSLGLLDCHLIRSSITAVSTTDALGLSAYVRFLDPEIALLRGRLIDFFQVAMSAVAFARGLCSLQVNCCDAFYLYNLLSIEKKCCLKVLSFRCCNTTLAFCTRILKSGLIYLDSASPHAF